VQSRHVEGAAISHTRQSVRRINVLAFVDESGDTGLKLDRGSSEYFTVAVVYFEDHGEAEAVDERITLLRNELGLPPGFEFHFKNNSNNVRQHFFRAVAPYEFFYLGIALDKRLLSGEGFENRGAFYKFVCGTVFENCKLYLEAATVKIDKSGSREFCLELSSYLKRRINDGSFPAVKKVVAQESRNNNLLQMLV
jgi:hypothetical protein